MTPIRKTIMKKATGKMTPKMTQMLMNEKLNKLEPPNVKLMAATINLRQSSNLPSARVHGKMKILSKFKLTKPSRSGNLSKPEAAADAVDWANQPISRQNRDGDRVSTAAGQ